MVVLNCKVINSETLSVTRMKKRKVHYENKNSYKYKMFMKLGKLLYNVDKTNRKV